MVLALTLADALEALGDENLTRISVLLSRGKFITWQKEQTINLPSAQTGNMLFVVKGILAISNIGRDGSHGASIPVFPAGFLNTDSNSDRSLEQVFSAVTDVNVVVVPNHIAKKWMNTNLDSATAMLDYFHEQSMSVTETLKIVGAHSVQDRAIGFIEQFVRHHKPSLSDQRGQTYRWEISQQSFATLIGSNRSHLSVVLGKLRDSGEAAISARTLFVPMSSSISQ